MSLDDDSGRFVKASKLLALEKQRREAEESIDTNGNSNDLSLDTIKTRKSLLIPQFAVLANDTSSSSDFFSRGSDSPS